MKKNDILTLKITGMTDDGSGVGRENGTVVFVPYTIVGETVRAVIIKITKSYAVGKLIDVLSPSVERTKSACGSYYKCGGCSLWHMSYSEELRFKRQKVYDCLTRIGGLSDPIVDETLPSPSIESYRNKSQFPVTPDGIGMYAKHSHRIINTDECRIASLDARSIIAAARKWMTEFDIPPYDEKSRHGIVRTIYTRCGDSGTLVTIVTAKSKLPHTNELIEALLDSGVKICGIIQNINPKNTNIVLGRENKTLYGVPYVSDTIGGLKFKISPLSFYQVNKKQTNRLYDIAKKYAGLTGCETVLDMYCGIGTIGLFMADKAKKIIGVETVPDAVKDARENAELNGILNAEYLLGKSENVIDDIIGRNIEPDVVILDPPRKGCDEKLLSGIAELKSVRKIVYISCKPSTLARDIRCLTQLGFRPEKITPVDMFPRTPHVETVVLLSKIYAK